jgi:hypothetical protein
MTRPARLRFIALFLSIGFAALTQGPLYAQERKFTEKAQTVPLDQVIAVTEMALNDYQAQAEASKGKPGELPPLLSADFDFKTVVDTKGTGGINLYVFTLGATKDKQATTDLDFQYAPHPAEKIGIQGFGKETKTLYQGIIDTLTEASKAIAKAGETAAPPSQPSLDFCQLSITLSFGVTTDVQGGVKFPFQLITISATLDRSKNNVQQVKLVFKVKDLKATACKQP